MYWGVYAGIRRTPTSGVFWQRILTSFVIIKQGIGYGDIRIGAGAYTVVALDTIIVLAYLLTYGKCRGTFWPIREYIFYQF